jgi:regulator of protease activity HflC (stomatin/prohibitin superfamily)
MSYIVVAFVLIIALSGLRIADQYVRGVVFRLGSYQSTKGPGLYWIIPLIEWQRKVDLRINTVAVEQQETITNDNVPIKVNAVVWYRVVSPMASVLEVKNIDTAVIQVALTTLRTGIGQHSLD